MEGTAIDAYVSAFVGQCSAMWRPGGPHVSEPGLHGLLSTAEDPRTRLLITDDRCYDVLVGLLPHATAGTINVFAPAARCAELLRGDAVWKPKAVTAMVCRDLRDVPAVPLPSGVTLRPVRRLAGDPLDGVPLEQAVAAMLLANPDGDTPPDVFTSYLRSLAPGFQLFAAVDDAGLVRATSGSGVSGTAANVFFVNTVPEWRGRGVGRAMSAAALRSARDRGARRARLDASGAGLRIYLRLGFEAITAATQFVRGT